MSTLSLYFISGPLIGLSYSLEKPEIILGNGDNCSICLKSDMISASYMRLYVGGRNTTILINSSDYLPVLNNELVLQPEKIKSGDVLFFPDNSIAYFKTDSEDLDAVIDLQQNIVSVCGDENQMIITIPKFSPEYFCWYGFKKLYNEDYSLAEKYFVEAQKYNPYYAQIYRGLLFRDLHISSENDILVWKNDIENNTNYQAFLNYSSVDEKNELLSRKQKILFEEQQTMYDEATRIIQIAKEPGDFNCAIQRLNQIQDFRDSRQLLDYCQKERSIRNEEKQKWESSIRHEQNKIEKKSRNLKIFFAFSIILLIFGCILSVIKIKNNQDKAFVNMLLTAEDNQRNEILHLVSEQYEQSPAKYFGLGKKAFREAYTSGNIDQCFYIANLFLLNDMSQNDFSSFLGYDYRDFAVMFTKYNTISTFLNTYDYKKRKTPKEIAVVQIPAIILEESTKTGLELISNSEFEKSLALVEFFEYRTDMSSVVKAVIQPMFIAQKVNTDNGYYDDNSHKFKDSSKRDSIGWIVETKTTYYGDLACRKTRYYDTAPRWEGEPDYSWYYKGDYVSGSSCSQLNSVVSKLTSYTFGPFSVKENKETYVFENQQENKKFEVSKK